MLSRAMLARNRFCNNNFGISNSDRKPFSDILHTKTTTYSKTNSVMLTAHGVATTLVAEACSTSPDVSSSPTEVVHNQSVA